MGARGGGANARTSEHKNAVPHSDRKRVPGLEPIALPVSSFCRHQQIHMLPLPQDYSDSIEQTSQNRDRKTEDCNPPMPKIVEVVDEWKREIAGDCNVLRKVKFKCPFCTHTVKRKSDLKRHLRSHTGERPYSCNSCGKRFTRLEHLRNHHLSVHKSREIITCKVCKKPFTGIANKTLQDGAKTLGLCINCIDPTNSDEPINLDSHTDHDTEFQESDKESG
ncbi:zinc finger and BTB domain-containing protein 8A.1-B-like isoform X2 [Rhinoraja longicauda]